MSIRILNPNGTVQQLSARMTTDFQQELRRIGEAPSAPTATVNLWVSNRTPEELLEILKRMPARPAAASGHVLQSEISAPEGSDANSTFASPTMNQASNALTGAPAVDDQPASVPPTSLYSMAISQLQRPGRIYNSVYQRETGHIFADPFGTGDLVILDDGRDVNLREEWRKERERERRSGGEGESGEREEGGDGGI